MKPLRKLDLDLKQAKDRGDIERYTALRHKRCQISPFDKYRIRLMGDIMKPKGMVLDIGCNVGQMIKFYNRCFVVFCDIDELALRGAKSDSERYSKLKVVAGNLNNLPFKDNYFDTIVSLETIEHLWRQEQSWAIKEILRVAKTGSNIYLSTPNKFSLAGLEGKVIELLGHKWNAWDNDHKLVYYSWEFIRMLKGFKVAIKKIYGSYFLTGSLTIRLPLWLQDCLGFISYLIARFVGDLFPFRYIGFTTIVALRKV